jgi:hypothetical protein
MALRAWLCRTIWRRSRFDERNRPIAPIGLLRDEAPIPDFFTLSPQALASPRVCLDPESPAAQTMLAQPDLQEEMARRMIERAQALAAAGKFIRPIPGRGLKSASTDGILEAHPYSQVTRRDDSQRAGARHQ